MFVITWYIMTMYRFKVAVQVTPLPPVIVVHEEEGSTCQGHVNSSIYFGDRQRKTKLCERFGVTR